MKKLLTPVLLKFNNTALACMSVLVVLLIVGFILFGKAYGLVMLGIAIGTPITMYLLIKPMKVMIDRIRVAVGLNPEEQNGA